MNQTYKMTESAWTSKINWTALGIFMLAGLANPDFYSWMASVGICIPANLTTYLIQIFAALVFIFRTYYTQSTAPAITQEVPPGPPDVVLTETEGPTFTGKIDP